LNKVGRKALVLLDPLSKREKNREVYKLDNVYFVFLNIKK